MGVAGPPRGWLPTQLGHQLHQPRLRQLSDLGPVLGMVHNPPQLLRVAAALQHLSHARVHQDLAQLRQGTGWC